MRGGGWGECTPGQEWRRPFGSGHAGTLSFPCVAPPLLSLAPPHVRYFVSVFLTLVPFLCGVCVHKSNDSMSNEQYAEVQRNPSFKGPLLRRNVGGSRGGSRLGNLSLGRLAATLTAE